ncbi:MAG: tetratricopeptide repeat protein [Acidobacteria bacterium]|nr:tetratricopeptide repeat protein [Acidobacteriota bacterium]
MSRNRPDAKPLSSTPACPQCGSHDVTYLQKRQTYLCEDCNHRFPPPVEFVPLNIFLSYGHDEHVSVADRIKSDLVARGHNVWFDRERMKSGDDWELCVEEGLKWAAQEQDRGRVVLLMTPHSLRRPDGFCLNEVARALALRLRIVPVMVSWIEPLLSISRLQWLDMRDCLPPDDYPEQYESRFKKLLAALEKGEIAFDGSHARLEQVLEPPSFEADISDHLGRFTGRRWAIDALNGWLMRREASRVFWITGAPGSGKTALASWLCYHQPEVKAFHFCVNGHTDKSDPKRCVLSIAYHLACLLPTYKAKLSTKNLERLAKEANAQSLFDELIVQALIESGPGEAGIVAILIDALDEASTGNSNELASFISSEFAKTPSWLRLIITSRPDPLLRHLLQAFDPFEINTASAENVSDLRQFLERELGKDALGQSASPVTIDDILSRSEGLFLYAEWVRQELVAGRLTFDRVDQFPQGLGGVYAQYFHRQFPDLEFFSNRIRPALELILAAKDPLPAPILKDLLHWERDYEVARFSASLGSLFSAVKGCLQPFHKSIRDWLQDSDRAGNYCVSLNEGHKLMAEHGWAAFQRHRSDKVPLSAAEMRCLHELHYHLLHWGADEAANRLKQYLSDVDVFVDLYRRNMYELMECLEAAGGKAFLKEILGPRITEMESTCGDRNRLAFICQTIGLLLCHLERAHEAEKHLKKSVECYRQCDDALMLAEALNDLAGCSIKNADLDLAESCYREALDIRRRILTDYHEDTAESINNYAHVFYHKGDYETAGKLYEEAFQIRQLLFDPCHLKIAEGYNNLGVVASSKGNSEKAISFYRKATEIMKCCDLVDTWESALYFTHLGGAAAAGNIDEAEQAFCQALAIRRKLFGRRHPNTLVSVLNLARILGAAGKLEEIENLFADVPSGLSSEGNEALVFANGLIETANALTNNGNSQGAERVLLLAPKVLSRVFPEERSVQLGLLKEVASYFDRVGNNRTAGEYYGAAEEFTRQLLGARSPDAVVLAQKQALCLRLSGDIENAMRCYARIILIGQSLLRDGSLQDETVRQQIVFITAVAFNEISFYRHVPARDWASAREAYASAIKLMKELDLPIELANMELNLQTVLHRSGEGADPAEVKRLAGVLRAAGDPRARKAGEIIGMAGEK